MKKLLLSLFVLLVFGSGMLRARASAPAEDTGVTSIDRSHAQDWSRNIDSGWRVHEGDDPAWAAPTFDDSAWERVRLDDLGPSQPGWQWYRLHIQLSENHPDLALLIEGGVGVYELYINGVQVPGLRLQSLFAMNRPVERTLPLDVPGTRPTLPFAPILRWPTPRGDCRFL
jgi:hypothetical protein